MCVLTSTLEYVKLKLRSPKYIVGMALMHKLMIVEKYLLCLSVDWPNWPMECANDSTSGRSHGVTESNIAWNHRVIGCNCVLD